ncbi:MAG TPA: hypothetical protein VK081_07390, partial [Planctomycetota bacterium]|nr:hypothetical protein [Planctomycetota bacterium]
MSAPHDPSPELRLEADGRLHLALARLGARPIKQVALVNPGTEDLFAVDVEVALTPGGAAPWRGRIDCVRAGTTHHLDDVDLVLDAGLLAGLTETTPATLRATARCEGGEVVAFERGVDLVPPDEWPGLAILPELLAAFVRPDDPAVSDILVRAQRHLEHAGFGPAFSGYGARDARRVSGQAAAILRAVQELAIERRPTGAGVWRRGLPIAAPSALFELRAGTALDLALLYAAALERIGLHPLVVLASDDVSVGAWTAAETFAEAAVEDGLRVRKRVDLEEIELIDAAVLGADARGDHEAGCRAARARLETLDD